MDCQLELGCLIVNFPSRGQAHYVTYRLKNLLKVPLMSLNWKVLSDFVRSFVHFQKLPVFDGTFCSLYCYHNFQAQFFLFVLLLKMFLSRRSDGGVYTCTAYNTLGNIQDTSKCTVQQSLVISGKFRGLLGSPEYCRLDLLFK